MKIVEYKILRVRMEKNGFEYNYDNIDKAIKEGWQPLGGVMKISPTLLVQAMVKYED